MLRILKYLKPYLLLILISIGLLFVQAQADLALPDYMSKIINDGIQQGGIINAVPEAVRQSEMNKLTTFMTDEDKASVLADYTLVDSSSADYQAYLKKYPTLATEPVYVLSTSTSTETDSLNTIMGKSFLAVYAVNQLMADPTKAAAMMQGAQIDLSKLPAGQDVFTVIQALPGQVKTQILSAINTKFDAMSASMITQSAVAQVKAEYTALGMDTGTVQMSYIMKIGLQMLLVTLLSVLCTILVGFFSARAAAGMSRDLRRDLFTKVESFSKAEFDQFSTASLITRTTNDITQVQMLVIMSMRMIFYAPIIGAGAIIRAVEKSVSMSWVIGLAVVILLGLITVVFSVALPKFKIIQKLVDRLTLVTREALSGMMVIRAFNTQKFEEQRFDKANVDLTENSLFVNRIMVIMMPMMMLLMNGLSILIIWLGAHQVANSALQVGDMMAFLQYAMQVVMSFLMLSIMFIMFPRASVSGDRIADVLAVKPTIVDPKEPKTLPTPVKGVVKFEHVSFKYPNAEEDVLHDITFTAQPGQTTAIIGSTGSGKSTVVNLIPRFFDVTGGSISLDGVDIRDLKQMDLRDQIGYIPQRGMLFSGTIASNLLYADENASTLDIEKAAEVAQATEFISTMPDKFDTEISQGGTNVSGGQKQRLSIARALVKKPPVYIFDDSFSALDFKTDATLRKALKDYTGGSTVMIVAQRIATIRNAEQIIVLDEGRVMGIGTHKELMESCETYKEIALSQLSKEELQ
ncbi:MAG: ABC transporter ATP-binding protein [Anaerolineaceae bacterium]|nr:ABC transporter ATP-binding protein [Anaerolineaceae bacterium]